MPGSSAGSEIGGRFDPMLAKIVALGSRPRDRLRAAGARARRDASSSASSRTCGSSAGSSASRSSSTGEARTDTLDRIWPPDDWAERTAIPDEAWACRRGRSSRTRTPADPWAGGWRLNAARSVRVEADGADPLGRGRSPRPPSASSPAPELRPLGDTVHLDLAGRSVAFRLAPAPDVDAAARAAARPRRGRRDRPRRDRRPDARRRPARPRRAVGRSVAAGDPIVTLEAMKMEHVVVAPIAGQRRPTSGSAPADQVTRGQLLAVIEP